MRTLSAFEYGQVEPLTSTEKNRLDQLRGPRNERLFEVGWRETRATSFVGVVQLPQTTLQVLPKMYRHEDAKEREATANLLFLLSYTRKLDVTEPEISRLTAQRAPFSEILFWIFAHRLWDAVHREVLRGYVTIEDRLDVLKGRWLVAAQSRNPSGWRRDRFDVAYDEFTEDNLPNRLFKATVLRLSRWAQPEITTKHTKHTKVLEGRAPLRPYALSAWERFCLACLADSASTVTGFDFPGAKPYFARMKALEFETDLHGETELHIPPQIASRLPDSGKARVILLVEEDAEDTEWQQAAYARFVREDAPEDSVYDKYAETR